MLLGLIFVLAAQESTQQRQSDDIVSISTGAFDMATNEHFTSLVKKFGLERFYSRPAVASAQKDKVDVQLLRAYIEPTGLPIAIDGNNPGFRQHEVADYVWDGASLKNEAGILLPFDGAMIVELVKRVGLRFQPGEKLGIVWTARQYLKSDGYWSDSILMTIIGADDWMSIEINDHATSGRAYRPIAAQFGDAPEGRQILQLTRSGWIEKKK